MEDVTMVEYDLVIIGGGPAGIAAAISAKDNKVNRILILERESYLGGTLNQCIHEDFGIKIFKKKLTGPEYVEWFIDNISNKGITYKLNTCVYDIGDNIIKAVSKEGIIKIRYRSIIFASGCREKPRGLVNIAGSKSAGIFTAGLAQKFVNLEGYVPGKEIVILGAGKIALIMARRFTLEGALVKAVIEILPSINTENSFVKGCLEDFDIPLMMSRTVLDVQGKERVRGITIAKVDDNRNIIEGTQEQISCDTIILSVELSPENDVAIRAGIEVDGITKGIKINQNMETNIKGVFACGNVLFIHDDVDDITYEGYKVGENAAKFLNK